MATEDNHLHIQT